MRCPLPIDWLEYLEGSPSEELSSHLTECRPCQLLVERLQRDLPGRKTVSTSRLPDLGSWPQWHETRPDSPAFGETWWSASSFEDSEARYQEQPRVLLLVLSDVWDEMGHSWCEVVPLATDIENATSLDVILHRDDTDLSVPWRAILRYQTVIRKEAVDSRIGALTEQGRALIRDVLEGRAPEDRFGSAVDAPEDLRVDASERIGHAMGLLGRAYALMQEQEPAPASARIATFTMQVPSRRASMGEKLALAAATVSQEETLVREVHVPQRGRILGRIDYRLPEDRLLFVIEEVEDEEQGLRLPMRLVLWSGRLASPQVSEPFVPRPSEEVTLARGYGVLPAEVSRLEVRISDEA